MFLSIVLPTKDNPGLLNPTHIGLICASLVFIAVVTIIGYYRCKTSTPRQAHIEGGDRMPADETCSTREKYEMVEVPSKGGNPPSFEEKGIFNQGME